MNEEMGSSQYTLYSIQNPHLLLISLGIPQDKESKNEWMEDKKEQKAHFLCCCFHFQVYLDFYFTSKVKFLASDRLEPFSQQHSTLVSCSTSYPPSQPSFYMFLYFSAFSFIIWTLWPTEYYYHHLSIVLSFLSILLFTATRADFFLLFSTTYLHTVYYSYQLVASHHPLKYVIMEMIYYYLKVGKYVYYDFLWGLASTCWSLR